MAYIMLIKKYQTLNILNHVENSLSYRQSPAGFGKVEIFGCLPIEV